MRISVRKDDPGFHPLDSLCEVFLDGQRLRGCFTADEEAGEAHCYVEGDDGRPVLDPERPGQLMETVLNGKVTLVVPDGQFLGQS